MISSTSNFRRNGYSKSYVLNAFTRLPVEFLQGTYDTHFVAMSMHNSSTFRQFMNLLTRLAHSSV